MIKTLDTSIAESAVETPWSANQATFRTHLCRVHVAQDRHKVHRRVLLEKARILQPDYQPKDKAYSVKDLA